MSLFRSQRRRTTEGRIPDRRLLNGTAGKSITSDFTRACDSSGCLAGAVVVDYTRQVWKGAPCAAFLSSGRSYEALFVLRKARNQGRGKGWTRLLWQPPDRKRLLKMLTRLEILKCLRAFAFGRKTGAKKKKKRSSVLRSQVRFYPEQPSIVLLFRIPQHP